MSSATAAGAASTMALMVPPAAGVSGVVGTVSSSASRLLQHPACRLLALAAALGVSAKMAYSLYQFVARRRLDAAARRTSPNQLLRLRRPLRHAYHMVRHGESTANVEGIISSEPHISTVTHGLTDKGRVQVAEATHEWHHTLPLAQPVAIISSDFTRARETAEVIHSTLLHHRLRVHSAVLLEPLLRERFFGNFNRRSSEYYQTVWDSDIKSADHTEENVESVHAVVRRTTQLILDIEERLDDMLLAQQEFADADAAAATATAAASSPVAPTSSGWCQGARNLLRTLFCPVSAASCPRSASTSLGPASTVILVAHGDVCQILATAFLQMDARLHRSLPHWNNGEMRPFKWNGDQRSSKQRNVSES